MTNHELVWKLRLCLSAIHFGYCFSTTSEDERNVNYYAEENERELMSNEGFAGYLKRKEQERLAAQSKSKFPVSNRQKIPGTELSALSIWQSLKLRCFSSSSSSSSSSSNPSTTITTTVASIDDAPIAFAVFTPPRCCSPLNHFRKKFLYLYFLGSLKCCVCAKTTVARLREEDEDDLKKGMEFSFPIALAKFLTDSKEGFTDFLNSNDSDDQNTRNNNKLQLLIETNQVLPWAGLRICIDCIAALCLGFEEIHHHQNKNNPGNRRQRNENDLTCSLGPVNLLPLDFEGAGNQQSRSNSHHHHQNTTATILGNLVFSSTSNMNFSELSHLSDPMGMIDYIRTQIHRQKRV